MLPPCHSRRDLEGEPNVFYCAHPRMHARDQRVTAEICLVCDYWREPAPETFRPFPPPPPRGECRHLGAQTGSRECPACMGNVRLKVFACGHPSHEETTIDECRDCPDHEEKEQTTRLQDRQDGEPAKEPTAAPSSSHPVHPVNPAVP